LTLEESTELLTRRGCDQSDASRMYERLRGWPMVTRLAGGLLQHETLSDVLAALTTIQPESFLAFTVHRTIGQMPALAREALIVTMLLGAAGYGELVRFAGEGLDDAAFSEVANSSLVEPAGDRFQVHPAVCDVLRSRFVRSVERIYDRTLEGLTSDGQHLAASRIALEAGDSLRAAAIIDSAPPYPTSFAPLQDYARVIDRLDRTLVTRYPNLWVSTIPYRSFSVDPQTHVREAETVYYCLSPAASLDQRATALMLVASAYVNSGRTNEADALVNEALGGFAREPLSPRAAVLNFAASLRGIEGRFTMARSLAEEAAGIVRGGFGEAQTLLYIESHLAAYRGDTLRMKVIIDELLCRRQSDALPLYTAYVAVSGALFAWVAGDDAAFDRYVRAHEEAMTPGLEAGFAPIIDAARGREPRIDPGRLWPSAVAIASIYASANAKTPAAALQAARNAAVAADLRQDPYLQVLAHTAVFLHKHDSIETAAKLRAVVGQIESVPLQSAVEDLISGGEGGMLAAYVARRVKRQRQNAGPSTTIELMRGRVVGRDGIVTLTAKEFELVALLASTKGVVSRERLGEALWDHLDPEEWGNNLKVTIYRVRKKAGLRDVIVGDEAGYRIGPSVEVDLLRAEASLQKLFATPVADAERVRLKAILVGFTTDSILRYDRFAWGHSLTARIADVVASAGLALAEDAHERQALLEVAAFTEIVRQADPYNESACALLMRALRGAGDADAARREFQRYALALRRDLDVAPSTRLVEILESLHRSPQTPG